MDILCTEEEVFTLLSSIDPTKYSGPDSITPKMLKSTAAAITPFVPRLFNLSLMLGKLPTEWKTARVVPIPKSSQTSDPSNYRPVSLLSILSKLLEKHIQSHLLDHLADNCPLSDKQWGFFLKGRSTTGALLSAVYR